MIPAQNGYRSSRLIFERLRGDTWGGPAIKESAALLDLLSNFFLAFGDGLWRFGENWHDASDPPFNGS